MIVTTFYVHCLGGAGTVAVMLPGITAPLFMSSVRAGDIVSRTLSRDEQVRRLANRWVYGEARPTSPAGTYFWTPTVQVAPDGATLAVNFATRRMAWVPNRMPVVAGGARAFSPPSRLPPIGIGNYFLDDNDGT